MAFPETGILDNFNRADGSLGTNWTIAPWGAQPLEIISQEVAGTTPGSNAEYWNVSMPGPDCEVYVTVKTPLDIGQHLYLRARHTYLPHNGYYVAWVRLADTDNIQLNKLVNGALTTLDNEQIEMASNAKIGLEAIGNCIKVYHCPSGGSWTEIISVMDSSIQGAGYLAMFLGGTVGRVTDFGGGTCQLPAIIPDPADIILAAVARKGFVSAGEGRQVARLGLAQLLKEALVSTYAQAVYHYLLADFGGLSPVIVVASQGTQRQAYTAQGTRPTYSLNIHTFTRYAVPGTTWGEEDAELRMDVLERQIGAVLETSRGLTPYWKRLDYGEMSNCGDVVVGGLDYRHEVIPVIAEVF